MTQSIKLAQEELDYIKQLQSTTQQLTQQLGLLEVQTLELKKTKKHTRDLLLKTQEQQDDFAKYLQEAYGRGSIDLDTGEFTEIRQ